MTKLSCIAAAAALVCLIGTPASAKVEISKTASSALVKGSTFSWAPVPAVGVGLPDPAIANEITANRLQSITEATLTAKGYRQVNDPEQADFLVSYTIGMMPTSDATLPTNVSFDTTIHTEGMVVLDLTERQSGRLVWRATSQKRVTGKDVSNKRLSALLNEMTKSLPAQ